MSSNTFLPWTEAVSMIGSIIKEESAPTIVWIGTSLLRHPKELGVWKGAGKLPIAWTDCTLAKTAQYVSTAFKNNSRELKQRVKRIFPEILTYVDSIYPEKYLSPIVFESNTGTMGRKGLRPTIGDIDDGCMRSIAFAMAGKKQITVYFGRVKPGLIAKIYERIFYIFQ